MTIFVSFYKSKPLKTLSTHFANQVTHPDFPLRFPKTKKSLMNEWLNETVEPVTPAGGAVGVGYLGVGEGVPTCYMRSPIASSATRRLSDAASAAPTAGAPPPRRHRRRRRTPSGPPRSGGCGRPSARNTSSPTEAPPQGEETSPPAAGRTPPGAAVRSWTTSRP